MFSKTTKLHNVGAYVVDRWLQHVVFSLCLSGGAGATSLKDEFNQ